MPQNNGYTIFHSNGSTKEVAPEHTPIIDKLAADNSDESINNFYNPNHIPSNTVKITKDNVTKDYDVRSKEYKELYDSGHLTSYDAKTNTYYATPLKEVTITAEAPQWLKDKRQFEKEYTKDKFIDESMPKWSRSMGISATNMNPNNVAEYDKRINDKVVENIFKRKPTFDDDYSNDRLRTLQGFSQKELELIKNSSHASKIEPSIWSKFEQGLLSVGNAGSPVTFKNPSLSQEEAKKENNLLNILQPLTIPSKMVQSAYKKDYSFTDALKGKQNNANIEEDILTDPLNLVGLGIWSKLSKANKFRNLDEAYQSIKGINKEEAVANLEKYALTNDPYNEVFKNFETFKKQNRDFKTMKVGDEYVKELNKQESLTKLKLLDEEYGTRFQQRVKDWSNNYYYSTNIGRNSKLQYGDEGLKGNRGALGVNTLNDDAMLRFRMKQLDKEMFETAEKFNKEFKTGISLKKPDVEDFKNIPTTDNSRYTLLHPNLHPDDLNTVVWHELAHDVNNGGTFIKESPELVKDLTSIFKRPNELNLDDVEKIRNMEFYKSYSTGAIKSEKSVKTTEDFAKNELDYLSNPTEVWSYLSTNLRQDLVKKGYLKSYTETLTPELLDKISKGKNTIFSRYEPYIKDRGQLIKMFNKMTLGLSPFYLYLQNQQNNKEQ